MPSAATLRQRLDEVSQPLQAITDELPVDLLQRARAAVTALPMGRVALDIDVFGMDNSGTKKAYRAPMPVTTVTRRSRRT